MFRRHLKDELLQLAGILTLAGPSLFGLALTAAGASTGRGD